MTQTDSSLNRFLLKGTKLGVYALVLTPLLYSSKLMFLHNSTKTYFLFAVSEITFVCFLWLIARCPQWRPRLGLPGKLFFLYIGILFVTSLLGIDPSYSFWGSLDRMGGVLTWLHLALVFLITTSILRTQEDWVKFFSTSTFVAIIISAIHLLSLGGTELIPLAKGGSTFGNSSFLAIYLLFHIFLSLYVAGQQKKKQNKFLWIFLAAFFSLTLGTVSANAAHVVLVGGMLLLTSLLLILIPQTKTKKSAGWCLLMILTVTFFAVTVLAFQRESSVRQKFIELSSESRFALWGMAWEGIKERPLLGWGLENFEVVALQQYDPCLGSQACGFEMWFDRAHNKLLDVWIESGLLGLAVYLALFATTILQLWRARQKNNISSYSFAIFTALLGAYIVLNLTVLDTNTSLLFWIFILAFSNALDASTQEKPYPVSPLLPTVVTILLPFTFFFFILQPVRGNLAFAQTLNATSLQERIDAYERATTLSPLGIDMRRLFLGDQTSNTYWKIPVETLKGIESQARLELGLAQAGLLDSLNHKNQELRAHIALGIMYQTEGHFFDPDAFQKAEDVLLEAIALYPLIPQPKWTLAGVYLDEGKIDEALVLTQSVLDSAPLSPSAYNFQLIVLKWKGDETAFEKLATHAVEVIPNLQSDVDQLRVLDIKTNAQQVLTSFQH